jgi:signal transduction histidine kinase/DNA-binding response OmpR family regulator/HAMP domain-containing protein
MNKQNTKIGTRLVLGFGIITLFVMILSGLAYWQSQQLWQNTDDLYNHPLHVARATRDIKADLLIMHGAIKDIAQETNPNEIQIATNEFNAAKQRINQSFIILYDRYLGPKDDIDSANLAYQDWQNITDETRRLKSAGFSDSAEKRTERNGVGGKQVSKILAHIDTIIKFAKDKSDTFYTNAENTKDKLTLQLWIVICIILIFTCIIAYYLLSSIRTPLKALTLAADKYSEGNYNSRVDYIFNNEIGIVATAFNRLAESVQNNIVVKEKAVRITDLIMKGNELKMFSKNLLSVLIEETNSQIAAIYYYNKDKELFEPYESFGLSKENILPFSAADNEGEFGLLLAGKKIVYLTDISDNTLFTFRTVTGAFKPRAIISIPILDGDTITAVISMASLNGYSEITIQMINTVYATLNERINGVLAYQKIIEFSSKLDSQNRELETQSQEMQLQSNELKEYNIELELQKKQLNDANQLKSSFLSNMSHELRTPLNSVIALSGVLNRKLIDKIPEEEYKYLNIIERNGKNLLSLINDILDISRIESGHEEIIYSSVSIYDVVHNIIESQEPIIKEKNITVTNFINEELPPIVSDSSKIHHILQNIIGNAIKFTEKGSVKILAVEEKDNILISIEDTGIGIAPNQIHFIFDEFRQADDKASRKFGGTGLGLAIAKKYSTMLEGNIEVNSKLNVGTVFTLKFPKIPSNNAVIDQEFNHFNHKIYSKNIFDTNINESKSILLVEDSEPAIIQMKDILVVAGYSITVARNGREALDIISTQSFDAMILDLMMPEVDGFEVLKQIRLKEKTDLLPVLILSAKHVTKDELSFLKGNNIHQLIQKGDINKSELLSSIRNMTMRKPKVSITSNITKVKGTNGNGKPKILLIEDNPDNNITVKAILGEKYEFIGVSDGNEGIHNAKIHNPDLILLDISLPGLDGYHIFDALRKEPAVEQTPIIAFTAKAMKGDREKLIEFGFDDYISKPIDEQIFNKTINKWLYGE